MAVGDQLLVVNGGDPFWYAFFPVAEGPLREPPAGLAVPPSAIGMVTAVGVYPSDGFLDIRGGVAEESSQVLPGGPWTCTGVKVKEASVVEIGHFGQLVAHVSAVFSYVDAAGQERAVNVRGNSREGLRASVPIGFLDL